MPWRGHHALYCKVCGGHRDDVGPLSARYKCAGCGKRREQENLDQLKQHRGPYFEGWRRALFMTFLASLAADGLVTEEQQQRAIDDFNERAAVSAARYDLSPGNLPRRAAKREPRRPADPRITERQRAVGAEIRRNYRKARGNLGQGLFLAHINMDMQRGIPRVEAEEFAVDSVRKWHDPEFTPLRA